jgi:hypothetical protein
MACQKPYIPLVFFNFPALNSHIAMNRSTHFKKIAVVAGAIAATALSSCTLPPEQAWRKIRTDGLLAYWSYELESQRAYGPLYRSWASPTSTPTAPTPARTQPTAPMLTLNQQQVSPFRQSGSLERGATLTAMSIPALPGFVRSPYTNPPRLIDVKGAAPGSTMVCPYTQRPFVVPTDFVNPAGTAVASAPTPEREAPSPVASNEPATTAPAPRSTAENLPKVVAGNQPAPGANAAPAPKQPATEATTPPAPSAAPKVVQEVPYGSAIAGRPGFVNSPFAAKYQLVDVTGLPAGMEVKCPYTGKLFRVPPQDVVSTLPAETAPLASPEEPKKK